MLKLKHLYWYYTDKNYRYIIDNLFVEREDMLTEQNSERRYYKSISNPLDKILIRNYNLLNTSLRDSNIYIRLYLSGYPIYQQSEVVRGDKANYILSNFSENFICKEDFKVKKRLTKLGKI